MTGRFRYPLSPVNLRALLGIWLARSTCWSASSWGTIRRSICSSSGRFRRCWRWARDSLPVWARSLAETQDLVQTALMRALPRLKEFEVRHARGLAGLPQAGRREPHPGTKSAKPRAGGTTDVHGEHVNPAPSPLEQAIGREGFEPVRSGPGEATSHRPGGNRRPGGAPAKL